MGSAPSARGIQPGGSGRPFRCVSDPLWGPPPGRARPPPGAFPPVWCAATGSGSARKGSGAKVATRSGGELYSAPPLRLRRFLGPWTLYLRALSPLGEGRGPPSPTRLSTGPDCPQSAPDRAAPPGRGPAHVQRGARGLRRSGYPPDPS